jgi:DNA-binding GntR family transcriptional regulator
MNLGEPLNTASLADQAYQRLDHAILTGSLAPGTLLSEAELSLQLGISRGPLREALSRLEGRKLVKRVRQQGVSVVNLNDKEVLELMQVREVLEGLACRLATEAMSDEDLRDLSNCDLGNYGGVGGPSSANDIHFRIAKGCGNSLLSDYLTKDLYYLWRLFRYRTGKQEGHSEAAQAEHREIIKAMRKRNADLAEHLMKNHIANARKALNLEIA